MDGWIGGAARTGRRYDRSERVETVRCGAAGGVARE